MKRMFALFAEMLAALERDRAEADRLHTDLLPHSAVSCPICQEAT